ncbi:MAG: alanine--tRNA ligase [Bdellovibrionales bacterium]|nr:alanine--tRNA ligase [Bdellovibrionales bacterium]
MSQHPKTTAEIREAFLKYFESQGHRRVPSSSLIPSNDPTLLFTAAGMVQFKDCFLGIDKRDYTRATSAQKCVRAGGKHNDLENVGFTARHHTFFEMMGNFSFGDYFKKEAIHYAWEFTTKVLGLPKEKLRVSVYEKDDESAEIWHKQEGVPLDRIVRFGDADNFWSAGDVGPCGPCTEIFYDQGAEVDGDRWLEFWNCVFMQYDRAADGTLTPLPKPSVDTGMGLERTAAILQGVASNYDTDSMRHLLLATEALVSRRTKRKLSIVDQGAKDGKVSWELSALRVIVDHLRSTSFLIADGVLPSNEGRGYVLRRILRRAVRFGKRLGLEEPFLAELYPALVESMGAVYPELIARKSVVTDILTQEESKFFETLGRGLEILEGAFAKLGGNKTLPANVAFQLYDTYGFPLDLTALIAREKGLAIDEAGFNKLMEEQQERSRGSWKGSGETAFLGQVKEWKAQNIFPRFTGYTSDHENSKVLAVVPAKDGAWVALDPTPFYGEGGGQAGEQGMLTLPSGTQLTVLDSQKPYENGFASYVRGEVSALKMGMTVKAQVDLEARAASRANHTATHLMHAALRQILGTHVQQAGSLVNAEKLRFDFSHHRAVTSQELEAIENWVNGAIENNIKVCEEVTSYNDAVAKGALAFFSEKYGDSVRMIQVPGFSTELCGGLHVENSGDIRFFKITGESAVAAGTRRIEAITRAKAIGWLRDQEALVERLAHKLKAPPAQLEDRIEKILDAQRGLEKEIDALRRRLVQGGSAAASEKGSYRGMPLEVHVLDENDAKMLREQADALRQNQPTSIHILIAGSAVLITANTDKLPKAHAGEILKSLSAALGGRGGGQAQTAQGQIPAAKPAGILAWAAQQA